MTEKNYLQQNIIHLEHIEEYKMLEKDFHTLQGMQYHKMSKHFQEGTYHSSIVTNSYIIFVQHVVYT